jgi:DNA-binding PadR family transcriptional regulator
MEAIESSDMEADFAKTWKDSYKAKKYIARPLYPERDARRDHRKALQELVNFLGRYGYWPATQELCTSMGCDKNGLVYCLNNLEAMGFCIKNHRKVARAYYELTPMGWQAVGLKPIEPWIRRPKRLLTQIAHRVTVDFFDLEQAQKDLNERVGTPLDTLGRELKYEPKGLLSRD